MIDILFNIAAIIGFTVFCVFALIGIKFTMAAWVYTAQLAINEWKSRKLKEMPPEEAKREVERLLKELEEEDKKKNS